MTLDPHTPSPGDASRGESPEASPDSSHEARPETPGFSRAVVIRTPAGVRFELNFDEYRLALLGLVDFAGAWDVLEQAAAFVEDGPAKEAIVRDRLRPLGSHLPAMLARGVDSVELLAARLWFRQEKVG